MNQRLGKDALFTDGLYLATCFCAANGIEMPKVIRLTKDHADPLMRRYWACIGSCAFYRPTTIHIAVEKCASPGYGGRAWSWPGYAIDRTPYGVIQHELAHHVDHVSSNNPLKEKTDLYSYRVWLESKEEPLTGYLGTDNENQTYFKEWFAENFRLFITNPQLCEMLRPKFFFTVFSRFKPVADRDWRKALEVYGATDRIIAQAEKKIQRVK